MPNGNTPFGVSLPVVSTNEDIHLTEENHPTKYVTLQLSGSTGSDVATLIDYREISRRTPLRFASQTGLATSTTGQTITIIKY